MRVRLHPPPVEEVVVVPLVRLYAPLRRRLGLERLLRLIRGQVRLERRVLRAQPLQLRVLRRERRRVLLQPRLRQLRQRVAQPAVQRAVLLRQQAHVPRLRPGQVLPQQQAGHRCAAAAERAAHRAQLAAARVLAQRGAGQRDVAAVVRAVRGGVGAARRVRCPLAGCCATVPCAALWHHLALPDPRHVRLLAQQYCALDRALGDARAALAQAGLAQHAAALTPQHAELERLREQNRILRDHLATYEPPDPFEPEPPAEEEEEVEEVYVAADEVVVADAAAAVAAAPQAAAPTFALSFAEALRMVQQAQLAQQALEAAEQGPA